MDGDYTGQFFELQDKSDEPDDPRSYDFYEKNKNVRRCLFITNVLMIVCGLILIIFGAYELNWGVLHMHTELLYMTTGSGILVVIISCIGSLGAKINSKCLLIVFIVLLVLILLVEMIVTTLMFVASNDLKDFIRGDWNRLSLSDQCNFEFEYDCCGFDGKDTDTSSVCCSEATIGCYDYFEQQFQDNFVIIISISIVIGVYQFGVIMFACILVFNNSFACTIALSLFFLIEALLAVFWESATTEYRFVFWVMYTFGCCIIVINTIAEYYHIHKAYDATCKIILEIIQCVIYIGLTGGSLQSIFIFAAIMIIQIILEVAILMTKSDKDDDGDDDDADDDDDHAVSTINEHLLKIYIVVCTASYISFIYYSSDSPFRQTWFDILLTIELWIFNIFYYPIWISSISVSTNRATTNQKQFLGIYFVYVMGNTIFFLVLCIGYLSDAKPGFEYGWTIFMIVSLSLTACFIPCSRASSKLYKHFDK